MEKSEAIVKFEEWLASIGATNTDWKEHKHMLKYFINEYEKEKTPASIEFEMFLESIGGVESAYKDGLILKNRYYFEVGDGWLPLIQKLIEDIIALGWNKRISQVKEKFGGLRFYIDSYTDEISKVISEAENKSYSICENCGDVGCLRKTVNGSYYFTSCDKCADERKNYLGEKLESKKVENNPFTF